MSSLKHNINNSLVILKLGINAMNKYVPELVESYQIANKSDLSLPVISSSQLQLFLKLSKNLEGEIEKLTHNVAKLDIDQDQ